MSRDVVDKAKNMAVSVVKGCPDLIPGHTMSEGIVYFLWALTTIVLETYVLAETTTWAELSLKDGEMPQACDSSADCGQGYHKKFYGKAMYPWALSGFLTCALSFLFLLINVIAHNFADTKKIGIEGQYLTLFSAGMTLTSYQLTYVQFIEGLGADNSIDGFRDLGITLLFFKGIHAFMLVVHHVVQFSHTNSHIPV